MRWSVMTLSFSVGVFGGCCSWKQPPHAIASDARQVTTPAQRVARTRVARFIRKLLLHDCAVMAGAVRSVTNRENPAPAAMRLQRARQLLRDALDRRLRWRRSRGVSSVLQNFVARERDDEQRRDRE